MRTSCAVLSLAAGAAAFAPSVGLGQVPPSPAARPRLSRSPPPPQRFLRCSSRSLTSGGDALEAGAGKSKGAGEDSGMARGSWGWTGAEQRRKVGTGGAGVSIRGVPFRSEVMDPCRVGSGVQHAREGRNPSRRVPQGSQRCGCSTRQTATESRTGSGSAEARAESSPPTGPQGPPDLRGVRRHHGHGPPRDGQGRGGGHPRRSPVRVRLWRLAQDGACPRSSTPLLKRSVRRC